MKQIRNRCLPSSKPSLFLLGTFAVTISSHERSRSREYLQVASARIDADIYYALAIKE